MTIKFKKKNGELVIVSRRSSQPNSHFWCMLFEVSLFDRNPKMMKADFKKIEEKTGTGRETRDNQGQETNRSVE